MGFLKEIGILYIVLSIITFLLLWFLGGKVFKYANLINAQKVFKEKFKEKILTSPDIKKQYLQIKSKNRKGIIKFIVLSLLLIIINNIIGYYVFSLNTNVIISIDVIAIFSFFLGYKGYIYIPNADV